MFKKSTFVQGYFRRLEEHGRGIFYDTIEDLDDGSYFNYDIENKIFYCGNKIATRLGIKQILPNFPECLQKSNIVCAKELALIVAPKEYSHEIFEKEICLLSSKKEEFWYLLRGKTIFNSDNVAVNLIGKLTNITKKHSDIMLLTEGAQRDSLTGLLNKITTERQIESYLLNLPLTKKCALLIIDIDNFKEVNDTFGHLYGDAVLTNLSQYIKSTFRESDILGRVGGDEFFVFVKNYNTKTIIQKKAEKVCEYFRKKFEFQQEMVEISASIGIAYAPEQGKDLDDIYEKADIALYQAKIKGKNQFIEYDDTLFRKKYKGRDSKIENNIAQKPIGENLMEYMFKLLYNGDNLDVSIKSALQFLAEHFNFCSGHIFELDTDEKIMSCVYEYAKEGEVSIKNNLMNLDIKGMLNNGFISSKNEYFTIENTKNLKDSKFKNIFNESGIKYLLNYGIWDNKKPIGFIGFSDNKRSHRFTPAQLSELGNICRMIGMFLLNHRLKSAK